MSDSSWFPSRLSLSIFYCTRQRDEREHYLTSSSLIGWAAHICRVRVCLCFDSITRGCCKCCAFSFSFFYVFVFLFFFFFYFIFEKRFVREVFYSFIFFSFPSLIFSVGSVVCSAVVWLVVSYYYYIQTLYRWLSRRCYKRVWLAAYCLFSNKKFSTSPSRKKENLIVQSWFRISFFFLSLSSLK